LPVLPVADEDQGNNSGEPAHAFLNLESQPPARFHTADHMPLNILKQAIEADATQFFNLINAAQLVLREIEDAEKDSTSSALGEI